MNKRPGFTLMELLVVIAIIAILGVISVIAFNGSRIKSRDAKRVTDLATVQTALEMYYNANHYYPTFLTAALPIRNDANTKTYLAQMPTNPQPRTDHGCPDSDYVYTVGRNNNSYSLTACIAGASASNTQTVSAMNNGLFHCGDSISDRDSNSYTTVQVNTQCWMAENLKTKTWPDKQPLSMGSNDSERDCITTDNQRGTEADCEARGALYKAGISNDVCPSGWHIPSDDEFSKLEQSLSDAGQTCLANRGWTAGGVCLMGNPAPDGCFTAGAKLKSGGSSGFNWQLTGVRYPDSNFDEAGSGGYLLSSSTAFCGMGGTGVAVRSVVDSSDGIQRKRLAYSSFEDEDGHMNLPAAPIRCIKD